MTSSFAQAASVFGGTVGNKGQRRNTFAAPSSAKRTSSDNKAVFTPSKSMTTTKKTVFTPTKSPTKSTPSPKTAAKAATTTASKDKDWDHLVELAQRYDQFKAREVQEKKRRASQAADTGNTPAASSPPVAAMDKNALKARLEGIMSAANGNSKYSTKDLSWLDEAFISEHLQEQEQNGSKVLIFQFADPKLFHQTFDKSTTANEKKRVAMIDTFVETLLSHKSAKEITELNFCNGLLPDEFIEALCDQLLVHREPLPKLQILNLEGNMLAETGAKALAAVIAANTCRYLQVLKLENQQSDLSSTAEDTLSQAIASSLASHIVVCSWTIRGTMARTTVNSTVASNLEDLRVARRQHAAKTGTLQERRRNEMEVYFDQIAANTPTAKAPTAIDLVGNLQFLALSAAEKGKAGMSLAHNTHIVTLKMVKLQLDDAFAQAFGTALATNTTLTQVIVDSNAISGQGLRDMFAGLARHPCMVEFQARHQSKSMSSRDEEALPKLLLLEEESEKKENANCTLIKLGVDVRNPMVKTALDRKINANRELQRKRRSLAKKQQQQ